MGERLLLPAVREAEDETLIIADGFSCREQIEQTTDRKVLHLAQVLQMALHQADLSNTDQRPEVQAERLVAPLCGSPWSPRRVAASLAIGSSALGIVGLAILKHHHALQTPHSI